MQSSNNPQIIISNASHPIIEHEQRRKMTKQFVLPLPFHQISPVSEPQSLLGQADPTPLVGTPNPTGWLRMVRTGFPNMIIVIIQDIL